ncbi:hypothetical protein O6H91_10G041200 [Diphasiastrum complanatum]|uniref:Uncharacterized protein n=1 Tax=Diphasiastrum complanatum TaxID=34168 RepID=A0ACC2CGA9_DIPCM|nr:hypothetical protein O6H91_10G041200 [Diphasiastrum complanatum]
MAARADRSRWDGERWSRLQTKDAIIVLLGVVLHATYMLSIFDIYFKTPIVHGMDPVPPRFHTPPAKRLVLFVADGLRADKFFELQPDGKPRAPFLHNIMHTKGRWGVSHARPPTESRPGHVAIIAGFYEDPSAVTKGWKANPVEFDSLFNRSKHTLAFGSPDIVPIFCGGLTHAYCDSYPHEFEDFATDASFLDEWSFDHFMGTLNKSKTDSELHKLLASDQLVIFLHLLGCDTNGHAHRPYSSIYLNNIRVVDEGVENVIKLIEEHFADEKTAYVFTADHGMSDKGSHGDGDPANTETPLVVWGAGIRGPSLASPEDEMDDASKFVDDHNHHMTTPSNWGLETVERLDVNQGDIAPLMSTILGLPSPMNSVGILPLRYLGLDKEEEAEALFANAKQILNQVLQKSQLKQATSINFRPFTPLNGHHDILKRINMQIRQRQYQAAIQLSLDLIGLSLDGLHYFQTYDWLFLMATIITGYLGWMIYVLFHVLKNYASFDCCQQYTTNKTLSTSLSIAGGLLMVACSSILLIEHSPPLYHMYVALAIYFWTQILKEFSIFSIIWSSMCKATIIKLIFAAFISVLVLQLLVLSFFKREVYTGIFLILGVVGARISVVLCNNRGVSWVSAFIWVACWFLSGFTLMPAQIPDNTLLVIGSGFILIIISLLAWWVDLSSLKDKALRSIVLHPSTTNQPQIHVLFVIQVILVLLSTIMVWTTTSYRKYNNGLPVFHQVINWSLAGLSMLLPLKSPPVALGRLFSILLGFASPFLLLSIGYEALFYFALGTVLLSWIITESAIANYHYAANDLMQLFQFNFATTISQPLVFGLGTNQQYRKLKLADMHVALSFLILINVAFFGTGNVASIASFEISSVYRFITVFNPYLMGALLLFKLFIPFILVTCTFSTVVKILHLPRLGCYFVVLLLSDIMTIHFFFLVRTTGSWMEIGNSISHFGIMSAQVVFVLLLFALTTIYTEDIVIGRNQQDFLKVS